ncbi:relaxase domain-containing protein [Oscillatoria sp. CS-180]|uniref:MobF family relaxase n=1 Tax=Oscillatoria sp. CS-180 TaxID=3021720 RepID=UPI00232DF08C|nr:MobF family relaxase [Oscillatoria sp. CS-180]MDB9529069.1 relaxase domain-containing protein [Oscillatoria sp. CS-180]
MLSINGIKSKEYYLDIAKDDYYLNGGEPPGKWHGKGAAALELIGNVKPAHYRQVIDGFTPDGEAKLVQNAGETKRQPGWDLTFSVPKTVSVVWSQADGDTRQKIQAAQDTAVRKALDWLEEESVTRRGKGGAIKEPAKLIIATFEHGTSRALDPQLHTHCLIMNAAVREDGSTGAIESQQFYRNKMTAGALYRAELSRQLESSLGLEVVKTGDRQNLFEFKGVDPALVEEFSKRRSEIEAALEDSGNTSAKAAEIAALDTRHVKGHVAREELFQRWQQAGAAFGYQAPQATVIDRQPVKVIGALQEAVLEKLMFYNSTFVERDLLRQMAEAAPGTGLGIEDIKQQVKQCLHSPDIVRLGRVGEERRYTTTEMLAIERTMMQRVEQAKSASTHRVSDRTLGKVVSDYPTLKAEQHAAVTHLLDKHSSIKVTEGLAGTGKTFMLRVAKEAWEREGYQVQGGALAAKAAGELEKGAGIPSQTIHSLLYRLETGVSPLSKNDVLVVDEAGMVGTRQMAKLVTATTEAGAKLVLVGDAKQLQPVEAGGAFQKIGDRVGRAELTDITRQHIPWMRQAVKDMIAGKATEVLSAYAQNGLLSVKEDWNSARTALVDTWSKQGGATAPQDNLIMAGSNLDVLDLNEKAQATRINAGLLTGNTLRVNGYDLRQNDRIVFTRNDRLMNLKNGAFGTITALNNTRLDVELDNGERRTIDTDAYSHIRLGYAVTTHKAQGDTRQQSFVLLGGAMQDRELSYVELSRSRQKTFLFTDRLEAGDSLADLSKKMDRSRQKELAATFLPEALQGPQRGMQGPVLER